MENKQKNSRKRLNSLILLVAFTAIMLIVSTYAWFSAQKNVTISNLEGKVNVAEGLMVSLDAKNWTQSIDLTNPTLDAGFDLETPYTGGSNLKSTELVPVSTTGTEDANTNSELTFYRGININGSELHTVQKTDLLKTGDPTDNQFPGYHAIDLFLQNSSRLSETEAQGTAVETLQLNTNSLLQLVTGGSEATGLQNTTRVALALYNYTEDSTHDVLTEKTASVDVTATQAQILAAYNGQKIADVAIWEPNAGNHVDYVVTNNNTITWTPTVANLYLTKDYTYVDENSDTQTITAANRLQEAAGAKKGLYMKDEKLPTYALTTASTTAQENLKDTATTSLKGIADIYNWNKDETAGISATTTGLQRQIALQTEKSAADYSTLDDGVRNLVSVTSSGAAIYELGNETGAVEFQIKKNQVSKVRLYIWLEGQDVDTINYASHGGGVHLDLGLVKGQTVGVVAGS